MNISMTNVCDFTHIERAKNIQTLKITHPGQTVNFRLYHAMHILRANVVRVQMGHLGAISVHLMRRQNFSGKFHFNF